MTEAAMIVAAVVLWLAVMVVNFGMWLMVAWVASDMKGKRAAVAWNMISAVILSVAIVLTVRRWL